MNRYESTSTYMIDKLKAGLRSSLSYHGLHHVLDVLTAAEMIGAKENISAQEMELLKVAVLFHDAGFIVDSVEHEKRGCAMAKESLPGFGYNEKEIEAICGMIMATQYPPHPKNLMEQIICDADLDYLGRDDYYRISETLFKELTHFGLLKGEQDWNKLQEKFLSGHRYFKKTSRELREPKKSEHLDHVKRLITS